MLTLIVIRGIGRYICRRHQRQLSTSRYEIRYEAGGHSRTGLSDDDDTHSLTTPRLLALFDASCMFSTRYLPAVARLRVQTWPCAWSGRSHLHNAIIHRPLVNWEGRCYATRGRGGMSKTGAKKPRPQVPDYCDAEPKRDGRGEVVWPAPAAAMEEAREFIRQWCVSILFYVYFHQLTP